MGQCASSGKYSPRPSSELSLSSGERRRLFAAKKATVFSHADCFRALISETQLKQALSHPHVVEALKAFVAERDEDQQGETLKALADYCEAAEVRRLFALGEEQEAEERLIKFGGGLSQEQLRLLQYELFFLLQERLWLPFCSTAGKLRELMASKSVRMFFRLPILDAEEGKWPTSKHQPHDQRRGADQYFAAISP